MWRIFCGAQPLCGLYPTWSEARAAKARLQRLFASVPLTIELAT
jgi:hypothetical protein